MKRSEINAVIQDFEAMLAEYRFALPPFLSFTPEEWRHKGHEYGEIRDNALGWDITGYGEGRFAAKGLSHHPPQRQRGQSAIYQAEKIMMLYPGQVSPNHFHWKKMEDIINRGGGDLRLHLWNTGREDEGRLLDTDVLVCGTAGSTMSPPAGD